MQILKCSENPPTIKCPKCGEMDNIAKGNEEKPNVCSKCGNKWSATKKTPVIKDMNEDFSKVILKSPEVLATFGKKPFGNKLDERLGQLLLPSGEKRLYSLVNELSDLDEKQIMERTRRLFEHDYNWEKIYSRLMQYVKDTNRNVADPEHGVELPQIEDLRKRNV